ncbi:PDC sensor domain-containing protein [Nitrosopumilus sp.]|uniref:PDC sensor domain-containing protein n=1 Tax=Nitrosopumilus sp. TaxID=2024843 RepID=UPI0029303CEB|nr:PDC sensor domain-containing protein [Nitrosopumilus sp.]
MKRSKQTILLFVLVSTTISGIGTFTFVSAQEDSKIPTWVKTAVGFWVNDQITDDEFLKAIEYFVENEMIKVPSQTADDDAVLIDNLQILQGEINMKIEQSRKLVSLPQIQQALVESNTSFAATGAPEEIIRQINDRWQSSDPDTPNSVAFNLINNPSADILRSMMDTDRKSESQFKYAEIFITNAFGANVAQSEKTSDYRQDDEVWWQKAKQNGLFLSEGGYDESAEVYASDVAIKILDKDGNFIGIIKAVINVESITDKVS